MEGLLSTSIFWLWKMFRKSVPPPSWGVPGRPKVWPSPSWGVPGRPASTLLEVKSLGQSAVRSHRCSRRRAGTLQGPIVVPSHWSKLSGAWSICNISPGSGCLCVFIFLLARDWKIYGSASNACVNFLLARVNSLPNFTLFHKNELCRNFALCRVKLGW